MATKFLKFLEEAYLNLKNLAILATVVADNQTFESWLRGSLRTKRPDVNHARPFKYTFLKV
jgi:hypothetical protein